MRSNRLYYLDFIRVLSMFFIIIFHFNIIVRAHNVYIGNKPILFYDYLNGNLGQIGVSLFFIISGVSLAHNYGNNLELKKYYKKRCMGLFPLFYIAWIMGTLYYFFRYRSLNPFCIERESWTIVLTLLGVDGYLVDLFPNYYILGEWFLGCIILVYILFPILVYIKNKIGIVKLFVIYIFFYIIIVENYCFPIQIDKFVLTRLLDIIFGMLIVEKVIKVSYYYLLPSLLIIFSGFYIPFNFNQMYKITIFGFAFFIVLMYIGQKICDKLGKVFNIVSQYSYAIFLCHHIVLDQICTYYDGMNYDLRETWFVFSICLVTMVIISKILIKINLSILETIKTL